MSEKAILLDGQVVEYETNLIGEGAMKDVYFTKDRSSVVCFFKSSQDNHRLARLESVLGRFNPLKGSHGNYWQDYFCWVSGIVKSPRLGVVAPVYPRNYFFQSGPFQGKEKEGTWFFGRKTRPLLPKQELGTWINYFRICIRLTRAIRRMHAAGLAHSDLSPKNVLIDPINGSCTVIDIDSLVVPGIYPPDVLGTRNYMAPEVIGTCCLPLDDPGRKTPSIRTDLHALATLIYQYLFLRHPLQGPKVHPANSSEEQETMEMGHKALFVEHPTDKSNRPKKLDVPYSVLGPYLGELFL
ncbi:serine/threonine-protein kinase, partial [Fundidesulfovibrio magnetotacticus]|uniref:serine/threonine-protein kinase n=1 Tax=Fundidesulfovibrio magnetotacticus TaxID=2730080 RepID=UPI001C26AD9B